MMTTATSTVENCKEDIRSRDAFEHGMSLRWMIRAEFPRPVLEQALNEMVESGEACICFDEEYQIVVCKSAADGEPAINDIPYFETGTAAIEECERLQALRETEPSPTEAEFLKTLKSVALNCGVRMADVREAMGDEWTAEQCSQQLRQALDREWIEIERSELGEVHITLTNEANVSCRLVPRERAIEVAMGSLFPSGTLLQS